MKSFQQFVSEAYDPEIQGRSQITKSGEGGRIVRKRKITDAEKRRVKAIGGGKTAPAKTYKDKSDIGKTNKKRSPAGRQQQPTQSKGVKLSAREQQRKARAERIAKQKGAKTKTADQLLAKKAKKTVSPKYKPTKATGYTTSYLSSALYYLELRHKVIISVTLNSHLYATGIYNTYRINSKGIAVLKKDLALVQQTVNSSEYEKLLRTTVNTLQGQSDRPSLSV